MRVTMSKQGYQYLANHMVYIQRQKLNVIKTYSLDYDSYTGMLVYLNDYINKLEHILDNAIISQQASDPPIMIFGSTAVIRWNDVQTECGIILPNGGHLTKRRPGAQIFAAGTPDAEALLFKTVGEDVCLDAFGGQGYIERIIYDSIFEREQYTPDTELFAV
jgi:transcription elongation GreA/GreB family factor